MAKKKAFMVPVQVMVPVTVMYEEIAESPSEAVKSVRKLFHNNTLTHSRLVDIFRSAIDQDDIDVNTRIKVLGADDASEYHSANECGICAKVQGINSGLKGIDLAEHVRKTIKCSTVRAIEIAENKAN